MVTRGHGRFNTPDPGPLGPQSTKFLRTGCRAADGCLLRLFHGPGRRDGLDEVVHGAVEDVEQGHEDLQLSRSGRSTTSR
jgi:hypothetical protein